MISLLERGIVTKRTMSHESNDNNNDTIHLQVDIRIQIASDLHIEFFESSERIPNDIIQPRAPILALLGDIGIACTELLRDFLHQQADRFEHVLFLPGNHEFYNLFDVYNEGTMKKKEYSVQEQLAWMKQVCNERHNLHFMERQVVDIDGVLILGTMLWSHIPQHMTVVAEQCMNDYRLSLVTSEDKSRLLPMTTTFTNKWHERSVQWLEEQIRQAQAFGRPVVVLTHHTPSLEGPSHPKHRGDDLSCCFSTDLTPLLQDPVQVWACGHTHTLQF